MHVWILFYWITLQLGIDNPRMMVTDHVSGYTTQRACEAAGRQLIESVDRNKQLSTDYLCTPSDGQLP